MSTSTLQRLYRPPLAMLTDLYELTMAHGYWRAGRTGEEAAFHLFFRDHPFDGGFTVACGLAWALELLADFRFAPEQLDYLASLKGNDGRPLFAPEFLAELGRLELACDIDAVPEGTVVFPHEPLLTVRGPILQAQLLESGMLNLINFQSLIATKAARICLAAEGDPVIEFGLRRAQGPDGALAASRAALVGGCVATSNVLAGQLLDAPVGGTMAHSWVMSFATEVEAFAAYAAAMPNNCVFLVDTYDSLEGLRHAIDAGRELRARGHEMIGVRLDSGDLAYLSAEARRMLDAAGFPQARIMASNELDEHTIESLKRQGARIDVWGVGTRLATAFDEPALGGVYKLGAVRLPGAAWEHRVKLSEHVAKTTVPGLLRVRRFAAGDEYVADMIWDELSPVSEPPTIVDPEDPTRRKRLVAGAASEELLVPVLRGGRPVYEAPPVAVARERTQAQLARFHAGIKRFVNPHEYPVGLELGLHERRTELVLRMRGYVAGERT